MSPERRERLQKAERNAREVLRRSGTSLTEALLAEAVIELTTELVNSVEVGPQIRKLGPYATGGNS